MNRKLIDLWVGFFVLIGIGAILFLSLRVGNLIPVADEHAYHVKARFENIGGLKLRAPVKSAGVLVGRVETISLNPKSYDAEVVLRLDQKYQFPTDTIAKINTAGLLGEQFVGLDAGGDDKMIADNGEISKTQSAIVLENLISQFMFAKAQDGAKDPVAAPTPETKK